MVRSSKRFGPALDPRRMFALPVSENTDTPGLIVCDPGLHAVAQTGRDDVDIVDEVINDYGDRLGTNPKILKPREVVEAQRQQRQQQAQQQQQMEQAMVAAEGAKTLSETDTGGNNALTALTAGLAG